MSGTNTLTTTFDPTLAVNSRRQRCDFTPAGGAVVKISCSKIQPDPKLSTSVLKQPAADNVNREVDEVPTDAEETITLVDVSELDKVFAALGGMNGLVKGTALLYVADPRDAAGKVRVIIGVDGAAPNTPTAFACSIKKPDGAVDIGGTDWSKVSLTVRNLSGKKLQWFPAQSAPDVGA